MNAPLLFVLAGSALALAGCCHTNCAPAPVYDQRTKAHKAEACLERFTPSERAPQIMTYDSKTGTEVHVNTDGTRVDVTGRNNESRDALGMGGSVGGGAPVTCTDDYPEGSPLPALMPYNGQ